MLLLQAPSSPIHVFFSTTVLSDKNQPLPHWWNLTLYMRSITYECGSKIFLPDRNKTTLLFFNIVYIYFNTYWYINVTIDAAIYPSQHFPFGASFVFLAGKFWTSFFLLFTSYSSFVWLVGSFPSGIVASHSFNWFLTLSSRVSGDLL